VLVRSHPRSNSLGYVLNARRQGISDNTTPFENGASLWQWGWDNQITARFHSALVGYHQRAYWENIIREQQRWVSGKANQKATPNQAL
jgi:hypothetical protein